MLAIPEIITTTQLHAIGKFLFVSRFGDESIAYQERLRLVSKELNIHEDAFKLIGYSWAGILEEQINMVLETEVEEFNITYMGFGYFTVPAKSEAAINLTCKHDINLCNPTILVLWANLQAYKKILEAFKANNFTDFGSHTFLLAFGFYSHYKPEAQEALDLIKAQLIIYLEASIQVLQSAIDSAMEIN